MRRQSFATVLIGKNILVREGIARILRAEHFRILASVSSVDELPSTLQSPQLLFLIIQAGDDFDLAVEHIGLVRDQHPRGRIAIVANHDRPAELALAFRAGASGYFVNVNSCDAFIKSIELVAMGETVFPPAFLSFALDTKSDQGTKAALPDENERAIFATDGRHGRAAALAAGKINSALPDRRRFQQMHSPKDRYRRGDREGPRQGDLAQDPGPEPDTGGNLGNEPWGTGTCGTEQCPALRPRHRPTDAEGHRRHLQRQANRGAWLT